MTEDVSAGRLHLDAYADTSGFARDAKAKIEAATKDLRAKIKVELDERGAVAQAREVAKKAQAAATARIKAEIDSRGLATSAKKAAAEASKNAVVKIRAEIDQARFEADLVKSVKAMNGRYSVAVGIDVDTAAAQARIEAFRAGQRALPLNIGLNVNTGNLGQTITRLSTLPAIAGGVYVLVAAVGQLAAGLFAVAGAASQAVVGVAALPNLIGVVGQGIAALFAGLSGIGEGVAALGEADAASAQQTAKAADVRVDSARAIAEAQRALKDAYHQTEDASRFAGYAVADAEWGLARAQEAAAAAQDRVTEARRIARERIDDLNDSLQRAALTEETAANNLAKARAALADVNFDQSSSGQERRDAQLAVQEAEQALADAKDNRADLAKTTAAANKAGVKGSDEVLQARRDLRDVNHSLMLAERQMFEARHSAADTQRQNARTIAQAQQAIRDAQTGATQAIAAQNLALAQQTSAFDKLSPAGQRFARFLFDTVMPRFRTLRNEVQAALLPPLETAITKAMPLIDTLEDGLVGTADVIGRLAVKAGELFGSEGFNDDTALIMQSNNRAMELFGQAGLNLIEVLSDIAVVAGPTLLEPFAKWLVKVTEAWKVTAQTGRETGTMADRFERARAMASRLASIVGNLSRLLYGVGKAATPTGNALLENFDAASERWANWANSDAGQRRLQEFFEAIQPSFERLMGLLKDVGELFVRMAETGGGPLAGALGVLSGLINGLNAVLATPYLGQFVGWLLVAAGGAGALGMVAGQVVKLGNGITLLARVTGLTKAWQAFNRTMLMTRLGLARLWVQQKIVTAAQKVWTAVVWLSTKAMKAMQIAARFMLGPWGIAIMAIAGLFVLLYKRVGWFRTGVQTALRAVGAVFSWLWQNAVKPALGFIQSYIGVVWAAVKVYFAAWRTGVTVLGAIFSWLWQNAVKPVFGLIGRFIGLIWAAVKVYFAAWRAVVRGLGAVFSWLWRNAIRPAMLAIRNGISSVWNNGVKPVLRFFQQGLRNLGAAAKWLWDNAIRPAWNNIKSGLSTTWRFVRDHVFTPMRNFVRDTIPDAFQSAVDGIKTIWDGLKDIARKPVEFVVNTVYNKGIRRVVNAIPGVKDIPEVNFATGGVLPGYTPGRDVHNFVSADGKMGLNLSGGEAIMRPEWTRAIGPKAIAAMNAAARAGGSALKRTLLGEPVDHSRARGGLVPSIGKSLSYWLGGVLPLPGATSIARHTSGYPGMPWAGDLNWPGRSDYGKPIVAWKSGVAKPFDLGRDDSYGRGQIIETAGGGSQLYAHMSRVITSLAGQVVRAGQKIGYVGDYGNTGTPPTSHLHFEVRSGKVNLGDKTSAAQAEGEEKKSRWTSAISSIKDIITDFPGFISDLGKKGGWGPMLVDSVKSLGGSLRTWINDKIPDKIPLPGLPDIPLPDNPIPTLFDTGGDWRHGTLGANLSGRTETVFTNENIVDVTGDLARIAMGLRSQTVDGPGPSAAAPLIGELTLMAGRDGNVQPVLADLQHTLRILSLGGVHAKRLAGASV